MAVSLTLTSATPYALKYLYVYDGVGGANSGTVVRTQAQLIADFLAGGAKGPSPLKALLEGVPSDGAWGLLDRGAQLSLATNMTSQTVAGSSISADLEVVVPDGRVLRCIGKDGVAMQANVEIRFHHTFDR
jgi:hypothetical protein